MNYTECQLKHLEYIKQNRITCYTKDNKICFMLDDNPNVLYTTICIRALIKKQVCRLINDSLVP